MNDYTRKKVRNRKRRIERRLGNRNWEDQAKPMLSARNIRYEMGDRMRGLSVGGIGMMHQATSWQSAASWRRTAVPKR